MKSGYFATKNRLEVAIDRARDIDGMEEYLDAHFAYLFFDLDYGSSPIWNEAMEGDLFPAPYWAFEGSIDFCIVDKDIRKKWEEIDNDKVMCQYIPGYYEPENYGDILEIDGKKWLYIASLSLSEEMEHQAEDGGLTYEYRGSSFLRVLIPA